MTLQPQRRLRTCKQRIDCRWRWVGVAHIVMWSVPLRDWLALEAAGSSLGWAEPMALQGGVLRLPGQQVKQSGESKALHTHTHTHTHLYQGHMTGIQTENNNRARCTHAHAGLKWKRHRNLFKNIVKANKPTRGVKHNKAVNRIRAKVSLSSQGRSKILFSSCGGSSNICCKRTV